MASRQPEDRSSSSLEIVWVRLNGSNTTIQDALRTVQAMAARSQSQPRQVAARVKPKALADGKNGDGQDEATLYDDALEAEDARVDEERPQPAAATPPRKSRPRIPKLVADLDFNSATPTFRDYVAEKKPEDQFDWYLLVASWMKDQKGTQEIGIDEVYTASRYIGSAWSVPDDVGQPFRDGRRQGLFIKGSKNGLSVITHVGEDRVKRMGVAR